MKKIKFGDIIFLSLFIVIIILSFLILNPRDNGQFVTVTCSGNVIQKYSLKENIDTEIKTEKGINHLVIENGKAYISYADCKNNICVKTDAISKTGESIVCLPHLFVVEITKE